MKKLAIVTVAIMTTLSGMAQTTVKEKVTVRVDNRIIEGYVAFVREKDLYNKMAIENLAGEDVPIHPDSVMEIQFDESRIVFVSKGYLTKNVNSKLPALHCEMYKKLEEGRISLFEGLDAFGRNVSYAKKDNSLILVKAKKKLYGYIAGLPIVSEVVDAEQVAMLFLDCMEDYGNPKYAEKQQIQKNVRRYNICTQEQAFHAAPRKTVWTIGFTVGYATSTVKYFDKKIIATPYGYPAAVPVGKTDFSQLVADEVSDAAVPCGITVTFYSTKNKHLSVVAGMLFSSFEYTSKSQQYSIKSTNVSLPLFQKYAFNLKAKLQPFVGLGVTPVVSLSSSFKSDPVTRPFKTEPGQSGQNNPNLPQVTSVKLPVFNSKEVSPSQVRASVVFGLDYILPQGKITAQYRGDFFGAISYSKYYGDRVSENTFTIGYSPNKKKKS